MDTFVVSLPRQWASLPTRTQRTLKRPALSCPIPACRIGVQPGTTTGELTLRVSNHGTFLQHVADQF